MPGDVDQNSSSGSTSGSSMDSTSGPKKKRWSQSGAGRTLSAAGSSLSSSGSQMIDDSRYEAASRIGPVSYKKGGRVKRTGLAKLHRGELVVPRKKVKRVKRAMKRMKARA